MNGKYIRLLVVLILTFFSYAGHIFAAPTYVQSISSLDWFTNQASISATFSNNVTAGNLIAVFVWNDTAPPTSVTDSCGNTYTLVSGTVGGSAEGAYAKNVTGGSKCTVVAHFSGPQNHNAIAIQEISGVDTSSPLDGQTGLSSSGNAGSGLDTGIFTTSTNGDYIFGAIFSDNGTNLTGGSGYSIRAYTPPGSVIRSLATEDQIQTTASASTDVIFGTDGYSNYEIVGMAFKPVAGPPDVTPPSNPTSLSATAISQSAINLSWTASTDNVAVTGYKIYRGGVQIGTSATNSYSDSGLNPATTYSYTVSAYDVAGNTSAQSSSVSATTQAPASDTTPPSTPTNLSATSISSSQINLSWTASTDNIAVTGYKIYRGGVQVGTSATNSYSDSGLTASTQYTYTVSAYDAASNNSVQSSSASATTQAASGGGTGNIYWVSPTGTATWSNCQGASPLSGTAACALATANANATAGNIVYLRGGTYDLGGGVGFQPAHSGTSASNMITFQAYTGETPTIQNGSDPFWLSTAYVSIKGMTFNGQWNTWGRIRDGGNHNEIANDLFTTNGGGGMAMAIDGGSNQQWATYNWIHDNHFVVTGQAHGTEGLGCTDGGGDVMDIGNAYGSYGSQTVDNDNYNTIENNDFEHAPHTSMDNYGLYTVIRNNIFHNEPWSTGCPGGQQPAIYSSSNPNYTAYNGKFGHRNAEIDEDYGRVATYVLVEGNRFGYAGVNQDNDGADSFTLAAPQNIVRYNAFYAAMNSGMMFKAQWGGAKGAFGNGGTYNRVYNNTFYNNGIGYPWAWPTSLGGSCTLSWCPYPQSNVSLYEVGSGQGNVLKNNLMYLSQGYINYGSDVMDKGAPSNGWSEITGGVANNWCTGPQTSSGGCSGFGDPKFTNPDISNVASKTLPDLTLQTGSGAIDVGTYLTTATNAGSNSIALNVADPLYFQDGTWGSDLARASAGLGGTMQADWICVGSVSNCAQIRSIAYGAYNNPAGTITLISPITWSSGAHIWLYKKSDAAVVLAGAGPDIGAYESAFSGGGADTTAPSVPSNLSATAISQSAINLSWTASTDNVGVSGYKIFRNGVQVGTSISTSYSDTGLTASTNYSYTVSAYDVAGNTSPQSSSANATTQAPATPVPGDLNLDHIVNTLDFSLLNSKWLQSYPSYDLFVDNVINSLDYAIMSSNWGKTW